MEAGFPVSEWLLIYMEPETYSGANCILKAFENGLI